LEEEKKRKKPLWEEASLSQLNIVLVEPRIPQNAGNIARTCAATGARLHLVEPLGFTVDNAKLKRAGLDYWNYLDITYYKDWTDFITRNPGAQCWYFTTKARHIYTEIAYPDQSYLVFGREDAGLPEELLLQNRDRCVRMPMRPGLRSLNLSNSVAIGVSETLRQWNFPELQNFGTLHHFNWEDCPDD
jgi:tRNA (cytidine/uridine-2'-O-)-methyltransferase